MEDSEIPGLILWLVWKFLLNMPPVRRGIGIPDIESQEVLEDLMANKCLTFASSLLQNFKSKALPCIQYFHNLPSTINIEGAWGICILVLKKHENQPKIYIGSGMNSPDGFFRRWKHYDQQRNLPQFVKMVIEDRIEITKNRLGVMWSTMLWHMLFLSPATSKSALGQQ